jgi:hypothetical protein
MVALSRAVKLVVPLPTAVLISVLSGACGDDQKASTNAGSTSAAASASPPTSTEARQDSHDISRIHSLEKSFPPGYTVKRDPSTTMTKEEAEFFGVFSSNVTFDPPNCKKSAAPLPAVGATTEGLTAEEGEQTIGVGGLQFSEPAPFTPAPAGCDHVTFSASGVKGTADRLPAPAIEGVTTVGTKNHIEITVGGNLNVTDAVIYYAQLSDQTAVIVVGTTDSQLLKDLLVKGVNAVRGG